VIEELLRQANVRRLDRVLPEQAPRSPDAASFPVAMIRKDLEA